MRKSTVFSILLSILAILASLILSIPLRQSLRQMGLNFIFDYQASQNTSFIKFVQNIISLFGNTYFIIAFLALVHLVFYRKMYTLGYILYIAGNAYLIAVEKQAYQDSRPFFQNSRIESWEWSCPKSYGFPSGHSWVSVLLYEPIISDLIGTGGWKKFLLIIVLLTGSLIPLSRQYLGSHSSDQVICGLLNSLAWLVLYKYLFQAQIFKLLQNSVLGISRLSIFLFTTLIYLVSFIAPFTIYEYNTRNRPFNDANIALLNLACQKTITDQDLQKEAGAAASIIGISFGIVYGLLISSSPSFRKHFQSIEEGIVRNRMLSFLAGEWNFIDSGWNVVKYVLIYVVFGGVLVGGFGLGVTKAISNLQGFYIVQNLSYCIFGISLTSFIPALLFKFQIIELEPTKQNHQIQMKKTKTNQQFVVESNTHAN